MDSGIPKWVELSGGARRSKCAVCVNRTGEAFTQAMGVFTVTQQGKA